METKLRPFRLGISLICSEKSVRYCREAKQVIDQMQAGHTKQSENSYNARGVSLIIFIPETTVTMPTLHITVF